MVLGSCGESPEKGVASAKADLAAGDSKAATIRLRAVLQANPQAAEARLLLGQILLDTGDPAGAEKELRKAFEAGTETDTVKPLLARALLDLGQHERLLADFPPQHIRSPEGRAGVLASQAYAQLARGNVDEARKAVRQSLEASPGNFSAAVVTALITAVDGDPEAASSAIDTLLSRQPKSVEALWAKVRIARMKGDQEAAIETLRTLTQVRPTDVMAHFEMIMLLWGENRIDDARTQLKSMKANAGGRPQTAHVEALIAFYDKNLDAARAHIARALKAAPDSGPTLVLSANISAEAGDYELAETNLKRVLARFPGNLPAQRAMVAMLLRAQRAEKAVEFSQTMLQTAPKDPAALKLAAAAYMQAGDVKKAQALFEQAIALGAQDGRDAKSLIGLGLARLAAGAAGGTDALMEAAALDQSGVEADMILVKHYVARKDFNKALAIVATMAAKRPNDGTTLNLEGEILSAAGRRSEARAAFERAYEIGPDFVSPLARLAALDLADGKADRGQRRFEDAIARKPKDSDVLLAYALWLEEKKAEPEQIRATIERAVAVAPSDIKPRVALAAFHASRQDFDAALAAATEANKAMPGSVALLKVLAKLQLHAGQADAAAITLAKAVAIDPSSLDLLLLYADAQRASGAIDAARGSLRKALGLRPNLLAANIALVTLELQAGRPADALELVRQVKESYPNEVIGYSLEGQVWAQQNRWTEAVRVLQSGIERTGSAGLLIELHRTLVRSGDPKEASRVVANWLKAHPRELEVRSYLADSALEALDYPKAVLLYKEVLADYPDDVRTLNNLAWAESAAGEPNALRHAERASKLAPDDPRVLDTLGMILVERGDLARGTEVLKRASAAAPHDTELRFTLAKALIRSGDTVGARRELEFLAGLGNKYAKQNDVQRLLSRL